MQKKLQMEHMEGPQSHHHTLEIQLILIIKKSTPHQPNIDTSNLDWSPKVEPPTVHYNLEPYAAKDMSEALKNKCQDSAPGKDKILYGYLTKLPNTHKLLAEIFTQIRDTSEAPDIWAKRKIILIPKGGETNTEHPPDFRMIE